MPSINSSKRTSEATGGQALPQKAERRKLTS